jgi:thymidylate synthase (FAD)
MKIIKQNWEFLREPNGEEILKIIEESGRTCYKSEDKTTEDSAKKFVIGIIKSGHHSVLEHYNISVRIITDRGVTHEIVRHRLVSYSQESTRFCNYSQDKFGNEITVILPVWFYDIDDNIKFLQENMKPGESKNTHKQQYLEWWFSCHQSEQSYFNLLRLGQTPQQARTVLPNSLKTEIVMTCNLREWRHFFSLRTSEAAHPQMKDLACDMLIGFYEKMPVLFEDIILANKVLKEMKKAEK